jgi:hypothetical protein
VTYVESDLNSIIAAELAHEVPSPESGVVH